MVIVSFSPPCFTQVGATAEIGIVAAADVLRPVAAAPPTAALARDGAIAIREEFDAARARATIEGWDLFIARHPQSPLIAQAEAERRKLNEK